MCALRINKKIGRLFPFRLLLEVRLHHQNFNLRDSEFSFVPQKIRLTTE